MLEIALERVPQPLPDEEPAKPAEPAAARRAGGGATGGDVLTH